MKQFSKEIFLSALIIVILLALANPFGFLMPNPAVMMLLAGLAAVFAVFAVFIWREKPLDEREISHSNLAGRIAFLCGSAVLIIGIIIQSLRHALDLWLILALSIMIIAKAAAFIYGRLRL